MTVDPATLQLRITDNGKGGDRPSREERRDREKYGISIMERLAYTLGGQLTIAPGGDGTGWSCRTLRADSGRVKLGFVHKPEWNEVSEFPPAHPEGIAREHNSFCG